MNEQKESRKVIWAVERVQLVETHMGQVWCPELDPIRSWMGGNASEVPALLW